MSSKSWFQKQKSSPGLECFQTQLLSSSSWSSSPSSSLYTSVCMLDMGRAWDRRGLSGLTCDHALQEQCLLHVGETSQWRDVVSFAAVWDVGGEQLLHLAALCHWWQNTGRHAADGGAQLHFSFPAKACAFPQRPESSYVRRRSLAFSDSSEHRLLQPGRRQKKTMCQVVVLSKRLSAGY